MVAWPFMSSLSRCLLLIFHSLFRFNRVSPYHEYLLCKTLYIRAIAAAVASLRIYQTFFTVMKIFIIWMLWWYVHKKNPLTWCTHIPFITRLASHSTGSIHMIASFTVQTESTRFVAILSICSLLTSCHKRILIELFRCYIYCLFKAESISCLMCITFSRLNGGWLANG